MQPRAVDLVFGNFLLMWEISRLLDQRSLIALAQISRVSRIEAHRRLRRSFPIHFTRERLEKLENYAEMMKTFDCHKMLIFQSLNPIKDEERMNDFERLGHVSRMITGHAQPSANEHLFTIMFEDHYNAITHLQIRVEMNRFWTIASTIAKMPNLAVLHLYFEGLGAMFPKVCDEVKKVWDDGVMKKKVGDLMMFPVPGITFPKGITFPNVVELRLGIFSYDLLYFKTRTNALTDLHEFYKCFPRLSRVAASLLDHFLLVDKYNKKYGTQLEYSPDLDGAMEAKDFYTRRFRFYK
jgi:hypothetical protein